MSETPEQRVARLEAELAQARVDALQTQLRQARADAGLPAPDEPSADAAFALPTSRRGVHFDKRDFDRRDFDRHGSDGQGFDTRLAPAPRAVPAAYRLVALPFSWWTVFTLFMVTVTPIGIWASSPLAAVIAGLLTTSVVVFLQLRRSALRTALLRWGEVARVVNTELRSRGTYYSGTTVQNVRMAQAHGWRVERRWYSGPVSKTRIDYELAGTRASLVLRGLEYDNGIILADSRDPRRALCVSSFPYDLERDAAGNWTGAVRTRTKVGAALMIVVLLAWTAGMCWVWGR